MIPISPNNNYIFRIFLVGVLVHVATSRKVIRTTSGIFLKTTTKTYYHKPLSDRIREFQSRRQRRRRRERHVRLFRIAVRGGSVVEDAATDAMSPSIIDDGATTDAAGGGHRETEPTLSDSTTFSGDADRYEQKQTVQWTEEPPKGEPKSNLLEEQINNAQELPDEQATTRPNNKWQGLQSAKHIVNRATDETRQTWKQISDWKKGGTLEGQQQLPHSVLSRAIFLATSSIMQCSAMLVHPSSNGGGPTFLGMFVAALVGSLSGFYVFLYFISLGFALGIGLPLTIALVNFVQVNLKTSAGTSLLGGFFLGKQQQRTILHSSVVILWSVRLFLYLVWREYWNWPDLHDRIIQVNQRHCPTTPFTDPNKKSNNITQSELQHQQTPNSTSIQENQASYSSPPSFLVKIICWLVYSFFFLCMSSPSFFRMRQDLAVWETAKDYYNDAMGSTSTITPWLKLLVSIMDLAALSLQVVGLVLESVADFQKSWFKSQPNCRYKWCGLSKTGCNLWKWSTHPNYLGEAVFWFGTFLGGLLPVLQTCIIEAKKRGQMHSAAQQYFPQIGFMMIGFCFIVRVLGGAASSLDKIQHEKYSHLREYESFRRNHGLCGPRLRKQSVQDEDHSNNNVASSSKETHTPPHDNFNNEDHDGSTRNQNETVRIPSDQDNSFETSSPT